MIYIRESMQKMFKLLQQQMIVKRKEMNNIKKQDQMLMRRLNLKIYLNSYNLQNRNIKKP